jgi:hypothetical protein
MLPRRTTIAVHLIFTGYGHWIANDIRGSGSVHLRDPRFEELGAIHHGRKAIQPPQQELRAFYTRTDELLIHDRIWFDSALRDAIAASLAQTLHTRGYTCWAFSLCSNHAHLVIRTHRDKSETIWQNLADGTRDALRTSQLIPSSHPLWAARPYKVFLDSPPRVWSCIRYIEANPPKENLPSQQWPFVVPYDNWPLHKKRG